MNKNKVFNYLIQLMETENNMKVLETKIIPKERPELTEADKLELAQAFVSLGFDILIKRIEIS